MNKLPLGTKVKVISAQAGAYGANGWVGTIVKNQNIQSGLDALDSEVTVKLEDETIWGIGMWDKVELEVMPTYNKAQKRCIEEWNGVDSEYCDGGIITEFLKEFNLIDPTPDPEQYKIMFKSTYDTPEWVENLPGQKDNLEYCSEYLRKQIISIDHVIEYKENEYLKIRDADVIHEFKIVLA